MQDDTQANTQGTEVQSTEEVKSEEPKAEEKPAEEKKPAKDSSTEAKALVKVSGKVGDIMKEIEGLTVLELSELVHALEDKFGVSAAAAAPVAVAAAGGAADGETASEQTTFNVVLTDSGANKISVIKAVRELVPTLGLKEAKDLVDAPPKNVLEGANKETANEAKTKLEAAGAKVELK